MEKWQGSWEIVAATASQKSVKKWNRMILVLSKKGSVQAFKECKVHSTGTFKLDLSDTPGKIILPISVLGFGFEKATRKFVRIYSLQGDELVMSFTLCDANNPPADFSAMPGVVTWQLKRVKG